MKLWIWEGDRFRDKSIIETPTSNAVRLVVDDETARRWLAAEESWEQACSEIDDAIEQAGGRRDPAWWRNIAEVPDGPS